MVSAKGLAQLIGRGQLAVTQSQSLASADLAMAKAHLSTAGGGPRQARDIRGAETFWNHRGAPECTRDRRLRRAAALYAL